VTRSLYPSGVIVDSLIANAWWLVIVAVILPVVAELLGAD